MNKFKNVKLTNNSVDLEIPNDWTIKKKDLGQSIIYFPFGKYPSLDVNLEFIDNPKIKSEEDIFNFLSEGSQDIRKANRISKDNYCINYRVVTKEENLELWKVLNFNKPRGFRILRLSLGWIRNEEADKIITSIIKEIKEVIKKIKFLKGRNKYDEIATLKYKLDNIKTIEKEFWKNFKIRLPARWKINLDDKDGLIFVNVDDTTNYQFFFEKMIIKAKKKEENEENNDNLVMNLIQTMTKDIVVENPSLKKNDDNNYLFSFAAKEFASLGKQKKTILFSRIWYRMKFFEGNFIIISFVFNYSEEFLDFGKSYAEKIDNLVSNSEIN